MFQRLCASLVRRRIRGCLDLAIAGLDRMLLLRRNGTDACHFIWPERMTIFGQFQNTGVEVQVRCKSNTECKLFRISHILANPCLGSLCKLTRWRLAQSFKARKETHCLASGRTFRAGSVELPGLKPLEAPKLFATRISRRLLPEDFAGGTKAPDSAAFSTLAN